MHGILKFRQIPFDRMIESEIDHVEDAVTRYRGRDPFIKTVQSETVLVNDLSGDCPSAGHLATRRPIRLQRHLDHLERIDEDGFGDAGTKTGQRKCLEAIITVL